MKAHIAAIVTLLLVSAAAGFQAGRASVSASALVPPQVAVPIEPRGSDVPSAAVESITSGITNILTAPFHDTYRVLKAASAEELDRWAKQLEAITVEPKRRSAISAFFKALMQVDATEAKRLMQAMKVENRWTALYAIKAAAPTRAMPQVMEMLLSVDRSRLSGCSFDHTRTAIDEWSRTDPQAVRQFIDEHPASDLEGYATTLIRNWAAYDPDAARELVLAEIAKAQAMPSDDNPDFAVEFARDIASKWVQGFFEHDRAAALDYLFANSNDDALRDAFPAVASALYKESPDDARAFIMRMPEEHRGAAISAAVSMVDGTIHGDGHDAICSPEFLADWMLKFPDHAWTDGVERVIYEWRSKDRQALFAWMSGLPAEAQEEVVASYRMYLSPEDADEEIAGLMNITDITLRDQLLERVMDTAANARSKVIGLLAAAHLPDGQKQHLTSLIPTNGYEAPPEDAEE